MIVIKYAAISVLVAAALILAARLVFALPGKGDIADTTALPPSQESPLWSSIAPMAAQHPGQSGVFPLLSGTDAFVARILLARQAQSSIDAQYYIWNDDLTGTLLLDSLRSAAERGVRVRLLVDDNGVGGMDAQLAALNALPHMEVRLFNPFVLRNPKPLNYLFDFFRLNHRMHNKSFTIDNAASVVGGRNIGDEYFDTGPNSAFLDLDVLAVGAVVPKISSDFDAYWASASSYPVETIVAGDKAGLRMLDEALAGWSDTEQFKAYGAALRSSGLVTGLLDRSLALEWTSVRLVSDNPSKALGNADVGDLMITRLANLLEAPDEAVDLVSAYFVPGAEGTSQLAALARRGVRTRILTNSFEATDVSLVHSGYAKYRRQLLEAGIELFELKSRRAPHAGREELGYVGSSGSSLHAKTFAVDGDSIFVGSFNFDPRSALLNTEMGLMIESPALAREMSVLFDGDLAGVSYRPMLLDDGALVWAESDPAGEVEIHTVEPGTTMWSRALVTVAGWLPLEWML